MQKRPTAGSALRKSSWLAKAYPHSFMEAIALWASSLLAHGPPMIFLPMECYASSHKKPPKGTRRKNPQQLASIDGGMEGN
jgi:hypothetical protein